MRTGHVKHIQNRGSVGYECKCDLSISIYETFDSEGPKPIFSTRQVVAGRSHPVALSSCTGRSSTATPVSV